MRPGKPKETLQLYVKSSEAPFSNAVTLSELWSESLGGLPSKDKEPCTPPEAQKFRDPGALTGQAAPSDYWGTRQSNSFSLIQRLQVAARLPLFSKCMLLRHSSTHPLLKAPHFEKRAFKSQLYLGQMHTKSSPLEGARESSPPGDVGTNRRGDLAERRPGATETDR